MSISRVGCVPPATQSMRFNSTEYLVMLDSRLVPGEMPYTCELCSKTFTFQQSYHKHLLYHTDEKKHTCTICGRAFKELSTLHNHERIHSGEKPYKCETCGMYIFITIYGCACLDLSSIHEFI